MFDHAAPHDVFRHYFDVMSICAIFRCRHDTPPCYAAIRPRYVYMPPLRYAAPLMPLAIIIPLRARYAAAATYALMPASPLLIALRRADAVVASN